MKNKSAFLINKERVVCFQPSDFGTRGLEELDGLAKEDGTLLLDLSPYENGRQLSTTAIDPCLLSFSFLQKKGWIKEKILSASKKEAYLKEAFQNHGLDYNLASFCFLDRVQTWTMYSIFRKKYGTDWRKWPIEERSYPLGNKKMNLKEIEDEILLLGFEQYALDEQWKQFYREAKHTGRTLYRMMRINPKEGSAEDWMEQAYRKDGRWEKKRESVILAGDLILSAVGSCDGIVLAADEKGQDSAFYSDLMDYLHQNAPSVLFAELEELS